MSEEREEYRVGQAVEYFSRDPAPPSRVLIEFAGPGSAVIIRFEAHGVVVTNQLAVAGAFLTARAVSEWSVPLTEMVARKTIETFIAEVTKPKIETGMPGFNMPLGGFGRRPA